MDRVFQRFAEQLTESTHRDAAQQSMAEVAAALELSCFAYLAFSRRPGSAPNLISTYPPSWTAIYLQRGYESVDRCVVIVFGLVDALIQPVKRRQPMTTTPTNTF